MGNSSTKPPKETLTADQLTQNNDGHVYLLRKKRPGCTGMFWRQDPTSSSATLRGNANWPRDGARLRGNVVQDARGERWLRATHVQQTNGPWKAAPNGAALPFEYNNHYYLEQQ